jgi:hypothetical protein
MIAAAIAVSTLNSRSFDRSQLKDWLSGSYEPSISDVTMRALLGADAAQIPDEHRRAMSFVLAVLRDLYTEDLEVARWLTISRAELGGRSATQALVSGSARDVESLVVREWNRS